MTRFDRRWFLAGSLGVAGAAVLGGCTTDDGDGAGSGEASGGSGPPPSTLEEALAAPGTAGLVDELILKVNPIVLGTGIPLFGHAVRADRLNLKSIRRFESGHLIVDYRVAGRGPNRADG